MTELFNVFFLLGVDLSFKVPQETVFSAGETKNVT